MLFLSRRKNQTILLGEEIRVTVLGLSNLNVRLGIEAPKSTPVARKELMADVRFRASKPGSEDSPPPANSID